MEASSYQRLREHLAYLRLQTAAENLSLELDRAVQEQLSATQVLERLLELEVEATQERRRRSRLRYAHYPVHKTLADFDFDFQPNLDRKAVAELSTLRFVEEHRNVLLLGPPGVGKTHLAIALGVAATEAGYRTYFTSASDLAQNLQSAHLEGMAQLKMRAYLQPSLLVIDELGYLPMDQASANWIFQVVSRRYDRGSVILYVMWNLAAVLSWEEGARGRNPSLWKVWTRGTTRRPASNVRGRTGGRLLAGSLRQSRGCEFSRTWACHRAPSRRMAGHSPSTWASASARASSR